jgi:NADPH:quinone reductase
LRVDVKKERIGGEVCLSQNPKEKMKCLLFSKTGSISDLELKMIPLPVPQNGEALIRVKAAAINPSDAKNVLGKFPFTTLPRVPGRDFSGVVLEGPSNLLGRNVFGTGGNLGFGRHGSHAEMLVVPIEAIALKPTTFSYAQAAALGVSFLTAWQGLINVGKLQTGETVLIIGAGGSVGSAATQLAKSRGARVLGTLSKAVGRSKVLHLPVDEWIALDEKKLSEEILKLTGGKGASLIFDTVGGILFEEGLKCLAQRGRQVVIASVGESHVGLNLVDFYHKEATLIGVDTLKLSFAESGEILRQLISLIEVGDIKPPQVTVLSLEEAPTAYKKVLDGSVKEKQVIVF